MEFKSDQANQAYKELIQGISEKAIRLYGDVKKMESAGALEPEDAFRMNLAVETFQMESHARAIQVSAGVEHDMLLLNGQMAATVMSLEKD